jgi:uncharacterized protein YhfF
VGDVEGLQKAEFAFPGLLRDRLVEAILDGEKTATGGLLLEYQMDPPEPPPTPGTRAVVVDTGGRSR